MDDEYVVVQFYPWFNFIFFCFIIIIIYLHMIEPRTTLNYNIYKYPDSILESKYAPKRVQNIGYLQAWLRSYSANKKVMNTNNYF